MPPFPWYIFQKNVPPICNSVKSSRNLTRTHYRNYMICKYNRFYQDCKCLRSWGPVGVTENPARDSSSGVFCFFLTTSIPPTRNGTLQKVALPHKSNLLKMFFACFPKILKFQSAVFPNNLKVYTLKIHPGGPTVPSGPSAGPMGMKYLRKRGYRPCNRTDGHTPIRPNGLRTFVQIHPRAHAHPISKENSTSS